jgi:hypothetical protein
MISALIGSLTGAKIAVDAQLESVLELLDDEIAVSNLTSIQLNKRNLAF